jgi:hypothetical protein
LEEELVEAVAYPSQEIIISEDLHVCGMPFVCLSDPDGLFVEELAEAEAYPSQQTIMSEDLRVCGMSSVFLSEPDGLFVAAL